MKRDELERTESSRIERSQEDSSKTSALHDSETDDQFVRGINSISLEKNNYLLPYIEFEHPRKSSKINLLLDSGSEINLLKIGKIPIGNPIDTDNII